LWFLALYGIGALELVFMWLPDDTVTSMFDEPPNLLAHRTHFLIVGIVSWAILVAILPQIRKPERRVAPMLQLLVMAFGAGVVYAFSGSVREWVSEEAVILVPVAVLAILHPRIRALLRRPRFERSMTLLAGIATIPWSAYTVDNSRLQLINAAGDPHAEMEHWATAALLGITVIACAFIGSTDHHGWRIPAWVASGASVIFGVHSLVFPGIVSALAPIWALAAIVWGVMFGAAVLRRQHGGLGTTTT